MKVKEENEKFDLQLNIQKAKIMASNPIISWQIVIFPPMVNLFKEGTWH